MLTTKWTDLRARNTLQALVLGALASSCSAHPANTSADLTKGKVAIAAAAVPPPMADARTPVQWRRSITQSPLPKYGCFTAKRSGSGWQEIPCAAPDAAQSVPNTGRGSGYLGLSTPVPPATSTISWAEGSFPYVSGVTTEHNDTKDPKTGKITKSVYNSYTLQLNANEFSAPCPAGLCNAWDQFIYSTTQGPGGTPAIFLESLIFGYRVNSGDSCPTTPRKWTPFNDHDCYLNSYQLPVPKEIALGIGNMTLTGSVNDSASVSIFLSIGNDTIFGVSVADPLNLAANWTGAEFNVLGDANGTNAFFDGSNATGPTMVVQLLTNSSAPFTCSPGMLSLETNNLSVPDFNEPSACCPLNGGFQFTQAYSPNPTMQPCPNGSQNRNQGQLPVAYQASNNRLGIDVAGTATTTTLAAKPGTVPSLIVLPTGGYEAAYQRSDGYPAFDVNGTAKAATTTTMAAGTSPSITMLDTKIGIAFQSSNNHLYLGETGETSATDTGGLMKPGTSPSIVWVPKGYPTGFPDTGLALAFQGSNGHLWISQSGRSHGVDTGFAMMAGTSPSIAPQVNPQAALSYVAFAFQGSNGNLWFGNGNPSVTGFDTGHAMKAGTSPSITVPLDTNTKPIAAYQASNGDLCYFYYGFSNDTGQQMAPGASPTVVALAGGGYQISYKGINGHLWVFMNDSSGTTGTNGVFMDQGVPLN